MEDHMQIPSNTYPKDRKGVKEIDKGEKMWIDENEGEKRKVLESPLRGNKEDESRTEGKDKR